MLAALDTFTGTQSLSRRVDPLHFSVKSLNASPQFGASSPRRRAEAPATAVPFEGSRQPAPATPCPLPGPLRRRLPKPLLGPAPARRVSCGVGLAGASGRKSHQVWFPI